MKYRFRPSAKHHRLCAAGEKRKELRLRGIKTLRQAKQKSLVPNYEAERFGSFEDIKSKKNKPFYFLSAFALKLKERIRELFVLVKRRIYMRKERRKNAFSLSPTLLSGALCASVAVGLISVSLVLLGFFGKYMGGYDEVIIPDLISKNYNEAVEASSDIFEYVIQYEYNPDAEPNSVIAQRPLPNTVRRLYGGDERIELTLIVNKTKEAFILPDIKSMTFRDASLLLKNEGINVQIAELYSDTADAGMIMSCSHSKGDILQSGDTVKLTVSLGKEIRYISVPFLQGLNESEAVAKLEACGLKIGSIKYESSRKSAGTVLSQSINAFTSVAEGTEISLTVSGGLTYNGLYN